VKDKKGQQNGNEEKVGEVDNEGNKSMCCSEERQCAK
jgi:hypothetical protein